jgi:hypothetical protein
VSKVRLYRNAPDFMLSQWSQEGDPLAEFELHHRRLVRQMVNDVTADPPTSHAPPHHVIYLSWAASLHFFKDVFGYRRVSLIIDPEISKEAIMKYWPDILAWRRRLEAWQGPLRPRVPHYLTNLKGWHQAWRKGAQAEPSLSELARWVNKEIAVELAGVLETIRDAQGDTPPISIERLLEYPSWQIPKGHWSEALAHPVRLMELWGVPRMEIRESFLQAIQNLSAGHPAFANSDEPIDRDRIWAKLKRLNAEH